MEILYLMCLLSNVENEFNIERELLLALMGIETNFGTYVGKMDILSSLATLSFDKRRSEFFTNELLILLRLIENEQIDYKTLYGSWAGAFGFFQFMPSTMKNYAIDMIFCSMVFNVFYKSPTFDKSQNNSERSYYFFGRLC